MSNTSFNQLRTPNKLTALMAAGALSGSLLLAACANEGDTTSKANETTSARPSFIPNIEPGPSSIPDVVPEDCTVKQDKNGNFNVTAQFLNRETSGLQIAEVELASKTPIGIGESWDDKKLSIWDNTAYDGQTVSPEDNLYHYSFSAPLGETGDTLHVLGTSDSQVNCVATRQ